MASNHISLPSSTGGGGAGDASAANQTLIIGELQDIEADVEAMSVKLPATLGQKAMAASMSVVVASDQSAVPVSASSLPLPTGAATSAKQDAEAVLVGAVDETAPASDTANSGLNGRLQRIAQRITSLIALLPSSLGAKTGANSFSVVPASDATFSVTQTALTGSYQEITNLTNSAQTFTAPAGAKWFKIMADDQNVGTLRYKVGAAATTTSGMQLQAGRSEDHGFAGDVSVICETADTNQKVYVQFGT